MRRGLWRVAKDILPNSQESNIYFILLSVLATSTVLAMDYTDIADYLLSKTKFRPEIGKETH